MLRTIRKYANEDKKDSNYRKREAFVMMKKRLHLPRRSLRYRTYLAERGMVRKYPALRRCASLNTIVKQRYFSRDIPHIISPPSPPLKPPEPQQPPEPPQPAQVPPTIVEQNVEVKAKVKGKVKRDREGLRRNSHVRPIKSDSGLESDRSRASTMKMKMQSALAAVSLVMDEVKVSLRTENYVRTRQRAALKQYKNSYRYEHAKEFEDEFSAFGFSRPSGLDLLCHRTLSYCAPSKGSAGLVRAPAYSKRVFEQLRQLHISSRRLNTRAGQELYASVLDSYYHTRNKDRPPAADQFDLASKRKDPADLRVLWYHCLHNHIYLSEEEGYLERRAEEVLQLAEKRYKWADLVKQNDGHDPRLGVVQPLTRKLSAGHAVLCVGQRRNRRVEEVASLSSSSETEETEPKKLSLAQRESTTDMWKGQRPTLPSLQTPLAPHSKELRRKAHELIFSTAQKLVEADFEYGGPASPVRVRKQRRFGWKLTYIYRPMTPGQAKQTLTKIREAKLDIPVFLGQKNRASPLPGLVNSAYERRFPLLDEYVTRTKQELFDLMAQNPTALCPERVRVVLPWDPLQNLAMIHEDFRNTMLKKFMMGFEELVESEMYNIDASQMQIIHSRFLGLQQACEEELVEPRNLEHIVNKERITYNFTFEAHRDPALSLDDSSCDVPRSLDTQVVPDDSAPKPDLAALSLHCKDQNPALKVRLVALQTRHKAWRRLGAIARRESLQDQEPKLLRGHKVLLSRPRRTLARSSLQLQHDTHTGLNDTPEEDPDNVRESNLAMGVVVDHNSSSECSNEEGKDADRARPRHGRRTSQELLQVSDLPEDTIPIATAQSPQCPLINLNPTLAGAIEEGENTKEAASTRKLPPSFWERYTGAQTVSPNSQSKTARQYTERAKTRGSLKPRESANQVGICNNLPIVLRTKSLKSANSFRSLRVRDFAPLTATPRPDPSSRAHHKIVIPNTEPKKTGKKLISPEDQLLDALSRLQPNEVP